MLRPKNIIHIVRLVVKLCALNFYEQEEEFYEDKIKLVYFNKSRLYYKIYTNSNIYVVILMFNNTFIKRESIRSGMLMRRKAPIQSSYGIKCLLIWLVNNT